MKCYYHSRDLDGWTSAAIVKKAYPQAQLIGWDYGDPTPEFSEDEAIYLVDISFPLEVMQFLNENCDVTWIDHHKSAINDSIEHGYSDMNGIRDNKFATCELAWFYLFVHEESLPEAVRLLGRYDCFGHIGTQEEHRVFAFQYGARAIASSPEEAQVFLSMNAMAVAIVMSDGSAILNYLKKDAKMLWEKMSFPMGFLGYSGRAINAVRFNPKTFGIPQGEYDFTMSVHYDGEKWSYSLYSETIDCSVLAKAKGGGGHPGAAGFRSKEYEFNYITQQ
jgi:oligoribonuclease NrnB/cAMP/cGMP phosphodiesterase (DHH superfamily)